MYPQNKFVTLMLFLEVFANDIVTFKNYFHYELRFTIMNKSNTVHTVSICSFLAGKPLITL